MSEAGQPRRARDEAFERLVVPEIPVLLRVAGTLTEQSADAEDLVQDTLVRAWRAV
ncbi:MAG: sigma factor, partial [Nocardioidaceae bacterium]